MAEKSIDDVDKKTRDLFLKGMDALEHKNYDYAISLFRKVLSLEPEILKARRFLRATQQARFKQSGGSMTTRLMVALKHTPRLMVASMQIGKNPEKAMEIADNVLNEDPSNAAALELLADAAAQRGLTDVSLLAMEWLTETKPKNVKLLHKLAKAYLDVNQPDKSRDTYERILQLHPNDGIAQSGLRNATAALSMKEGKWDTAQSYREVLKDKDRAVTLEQESRVVLGEEMIENQIRENEAKLQNEPDSLVILRNLGNLYATKKDYDRAIEYFETALKKSGGADPTLEARITEIGGLKYDSFINAIQAQLDANPDSAELKEELEDIKKQKEDYLTQRAEYLVARYPNETQYRFDLGVLYYRAGRFDEAVRELQQAQRHPQRRVPTLNCLGLCYLAKGVTDIARDVLLKADAEYKPMDNLKKEIIYNLGIAYEKSGDHAKAYEQFKRIYEADFGFRDVAKRIEAGQKKA